LVSAYRGGPKPGGLAFFLAAPAALARAARRCGEGSPAAGLALAFSYPWIRGLGKALSKLGAWSLKLAECRSQYGVTGM
jgi:hypothetical protein